MGEGGKLCVGEKEMTKKNGGKRGKKGKRQENEENEEKEEKEGKEYQDENAHTLSLQ